MSERSARGTRVTVPPTVTLVTTEATRGRLGIDRARGTGVPNPARTTLALRCGHPTLAATS